MNILFLFAHADDETLGAGGLAMKMREKGAYLQLRIVSNGVVGMRSQPSDNRSSLKEACKILKINDVKSLGFEDQKFELYPMAEIANAVSQVIDPPDIIITHSANDLNQDHQIVHQVAKIIARPRGKQVGLLGAEIPCVTTWNAQAFKPQLYVDIHPYLEQKLEAFGCYNHELRDFPDPYSLEGLRTLSRFRGMESGYQAAEAFEVIRWFEGMEL